MYFCEIWLWRWSKFIGFSQFSKFKFDFYSYLNNFQKNVKYYSYFFINCGIGINHYCLIRFLSLNKKKKKKPTIEIRTDSLHCTHISFIHPNSHISDQIISIKYFLKGKLEKNYSRMIYRKVITENYVILIKYVSGNALRYKRKTGWAYEWILYQYLLFRLLMYYWKKKNLYSHV
jgi:hypothetical protein